MSMEIKRAGERQKRPVRRPNVLTEDRKSLISQIEAQKEQLKQRSDKYNEVKDDIEALRDRNTDNQILVLDNILGEKFNEVNDLGLKDLVILKGKLTEMLKKKNNQAPQQNVQINISQEKLDKINSITIDHKALGL